jgi:hypothetical protein
MWSRTRTGTFDRLAKEGFPETLIEALRCVTRREDESYEDFVERSAGNSLARRVKIADLEDNMDVRRTEHVGEKERERLEKYLRAWSRLKARESETITPQS